MVRRYAEVLTENLGQPGFRELLAVATDIDARRDVIVTLLREPFRRDFMAPRPGRDRRAEVLDLAGAGRDHALDVLASALTPPVACDPALVPFPVDGFWRGETHRLCDRPGVTHSGTTLVGETLIWGRLSAARPLAGRIVTATITLAHTRNDIRHPTRLLTLRYERDPPSDR